MADRSLWRLIYINAISREEEEHDSLSALPIVMDCLDLFCSAVMNYAAIITFWNLGLAFGRVLLIAGVSSYVGIRKVLRIEPFDIFRG